MENKTLVIGQATWKEDGTPDTLEALAVMCFSEDDLVDMLNMSDIKDKTSQEHIREMASTVISRLSNGEDTIRANEIAPQFSEGIVFALATIDPLSYDSKHEA